MNNSKKRLPVIISICFLFTFAHSGSVFAKCVEVSHKNAGEAAVIEGNSISGENIILAGNIGNQDPIDSSEMDDPVDRTEVEDPIDRNDSERNDPIDKEDRDHHPINSAEKGEAGQGDDIDNDGDN
jgi:hypothetical protein